MIQSKVHRPHSRWQNYRSKGIYHITIVVNSALQKAYPIGSGVLGTLKGIHDLNRSINGSLNNIRKEALERGLPLILIQKEPMGPKWKPEKERFQACEKGQLLILAPWSIEHMADRVRQIDDHTAELVPANTDYSQFHNMNDLAAEICRLSGPATMRLE